MTSNTTLVSPELVLVDPELRYQLLSTPSDRAWSVEFVTRPRPAREHESAPGVDGRAAVVQTLGHTLAKHEYRRAWRTAAAAAAVVSAFVLGAKVAHPTYVSLPGVSGSSTSASADLTPPATPRHTVERGEQQLVWLPVAGASGYDLALYRGSERVFKTHTTAPRVMLSEATRERLPPGPLIWDVWPSGVGLKDAAPIVHSQIWLSS